MSSSFALNSVRDDVLRKRPLEQHNYKNKKATCEQLTLASASLSAPSRPLLLFVSDTNEME